MLEIAITTLLLFTPMVILEWLVAHSKTAYKLFIKFGEITKLL